MTLELRTTRPDDVPELGRICYEAFKDISERHGFPTDFPSVEFAQQMIGLLVQQEQVYGVGAFEDGVAKGSNYLSMWGDAAGVGPVSVDVATQGQGIGRRMMDDVVAHARKQGYEMVRLCQDAFNMQSLALYASVGFDTKEPLAYLHLANGGEPDPAFRPATAGDLDAMDDLCRSIYRISRKAEIATLLQIGFPVFVLDRGRAAATIAGYLSGIIVGHGVAETDDDMLALLAGAGATVPDAHAFVPLRSGELYRRALAAGHRNIKVMNLMALGPYDDPQGTYCPSVMY